MGLGALRGAAIAAPLVLLTLAVLSQSVGGAQSGVMYLLPALVLAVVVFTRRYPGERVIERLRADAAPARAASTPRPRPRLYAHERGGRLIARSLAGRAPPLAAAGR
jgi:hypothetical protein